MYDFTQIFVIGDIHGCNNLLKKVHKEILDKSNNIHDQKLLIYLGDYIDRGPNIKETIQSLLDFQPNNFQQIFLLGNHEQMMLDFINNVPDSLYLWILNGGDKTLYSYGIKEISSVKNETIRDKFVSNIPKDHLHFFKNFSLSYQWGDYFFVHAGIDPDIPLDKQDKNILIWTRSSKFLASSKIFEKIIVHGHTSHPRVEDLDNRINLDTGAFYSDTLTCLVINAKTGNRKFFNSKNKI